MHTSLTSDGGLFRLHKLAGAWCWASVPEDAYVYVQEYSRQCVRDSVHKLHTSLLINRISTSPHFPPPFTQPNFSSFTCVTVDEISKLLSKSPDTNCDLDPIPTSLLKQGSHILLPTSTNIINLSLSSGDFPDQFNNSVHPHLKKSNIHKDDLGN